MWLADPPVVGAWTTNKTVVEGSFFELDCLLKFSNPEPLITWYRNMEIVNISDSRYQSYTYPQDKWLSIGVVSAEP